MFFTDKYKIFSSPVNSQNCLLALGCYGLVFRKVCSVLHSVAGNIQACTKSLHKQKCLHPFLPHKEAPQCKSSDKAALAGQILRRHKPGCLSGCTSFRMNPTVFKNAAATQGGRTARSKRRVLPHRHSAVVEVLREGIQIPCSVLLAGQGSIGSPGSSPAVGPS